MISPQLPLILKLRQAASFCTVITKMNYKLGMTDSVVIFFTFICDTRELVFCLHFVYRLAYQIIVAVESLVFVVIIIIYLLPFFLTLFLILSDLLDVFIWLNFGIN